MQARLSANYRLSHSWQFRSVHPSKADIDIGIASVSSVPGADVARIRALSATSGRPLGAGALHQCRLANPQVIDGAINHLLPIDQAATAEPKKTV
jgi:hypothetical protein